MLNCVLLPCARGKVQGDVKLRCKHAYVEHIRGRLLHFKLAFDGGHGRSRRTLGYAVLPYAAVLPAHCPTGWPNGTKEEYPFSIPLYYGCALILLLLWPADCVATPQVSNTSSKAHVPHRVCAWE
jgi:hypothetical protein